MNDLILALKKKILIPAVLSFGILCWFLLCQANYRSYWEGTIYKVQTVDFNILHHTLPATLSLLIAAGRDDLVQKVLDSNYGIFGLVVANAAGNSIIYRTGRVYHQKSWQNLVTPEYLADLTEPYDLLTNPPPLDPVFAHQDPRQSRADRVSKEPAGQVLGRIYYVRQPPPSFAEDMGGFLMAGATQLSGARRGYLLITLVTTGFSLALILLVLWRKSSLTLKRSELEHMQRELEIRQKALDHLNGELLEQKSRKDWLEKEADRAYRQALELKDALHKLKESLLPTVAATVQIQDGFKVRPPIHPASSVLTELDDLIPELDANAQALRAQAMQLQDYCTELERRQSEMKRILEQSYLKTSGAIGNLVQFRAK